MAVVIGIVGPSCSGKSTLAQAMSESLSAPLLKLDGRYRRGVAKPIVNGHQSFERPELYDGMSLLRDIEIAKQQEAIILAEGFLMFCYPELHEICEHRFYLDVPHDELKRRRLARIAAGGDKVWGPTGGNPNVDQGWMAHGQEEWERFGAPQGHLDGVIRLDGLRPIAENCQIILDKTALRPLSPAMAHASF